jgi:hypothetical protein
LFASTALKPASIASTVHGAGKRLIRQIGRNVKLDQARKAVGGSG